ncbi:MAG: NYN domain-containing protein [Candidatus Dadabacteria bacterium]|nr:NYN domain-containing protein [Candidatus Dadabacteria bacterium]
MRFAAFVDGPNLMGSFRNLGLNIDDYQSFYNFVMRRAVAEWSKCVVGECETTTLVWRVFWYQIGSIDELRFDNPAFEESLRRNFERDAELKHSFVSAAQRENHPDPEEGAWGMCLSEGKEWYEKKRADLRKMNQFNRAVRNNTRFVDIIECGHWKLDILRKNLHEKGIDTSLAVDLATMTDSYDVAVVLSGDADMLPSINHAKKHKGKQIGIVELKNDDDSRGQQSSARLRNHADFVVSIGKTELLGEGICAERQY